MHNSGASRRGVAKLRLKSEPSLPATNAKRLRKGALATKQSMLLHKERMDCFVAPRAMTVSRRTRHTLNRRRPPPGRRIAPPDDRLQRAIQYSRDADDGVERPRRTGYPACAGVTALCGRHRRRHCEERSDEAIHTFFARRDGLLRGACHRTRIRATRWLAMTTTNGLRLFDNRIGSLQGVIHLDRTRTGRQNRKPRPPEATGAFLN
jgi:hypothetical protein